MIDFSTWPDKNDENFEDANDVNGFLREVILSVADLVVEEVLMENQVREEVLMENQVRDFIAVLDNNITLTSSADTSIASSINDGLKVLLFNLLKEKRYDELRDIIYQVSSKFTAKNEGQQVEQIQPTSIENVCEQVTEHRLIDFSTWPDRNDTGPEREDPGSSAIAISGYNNTISALGVNSRKKVYRSREERRSATERRRIRMLRMKDHEEEPGLQCERRRIRRLKMKEVEPGLQCERRRIRALRMKEEEPGLQWRIGRPTRCHCHPGYKIFWRRLPLDSDSSEEMVSDHKEEDRGLPGAQDQQPGQPAKRIKIAF